MRVKIIICLLYLCSAHALAQKVKRPDSYNYTRGVEAIQNNNVEEALKYLNKEVKEYPGIRICFRLDCTGTKPS